MNFDVTAAPEVRFVRSLYRLSPRHDRDDRMNVEQDRQCTYNATSRRVRVTIVAVEKQ
jgi:hypothetical protein